VETNLVFLRLPPGLEAERVRRALVERGILVGAIGTSRLRLVTHLDVDREACLRAAQILRDLLAT
jgi:threonine aldolase